MKDSHLFATPAHNQFRNLLEKVLTHIDVTTIKAEGGNKALKETLNHDFLLAIIDVQMPGMDGYELAELLRGTAKTKKSANHIYFSGIF